MVRAHARHILVATLEEGLDIKSRITGGEDFAHIAQTHSSCPSGASGGDLGEFGPGDMVKEFDEAVFSAPIGECIGPIETQFGFHLIQVLERR
ncbi:MAG: peptidylprolyl isomerase [Planctomycetes bacterium]|nr:peptidylprolyl isomerase [Planctomycetota bacterium]MCB9917950.1 peptidylprolyl isomerase [Planctomycetota bacterium]